MRTAERFGGTRLLKVAAGVLVAALLVATGWTAEKFYRRLTTKRTYVELEKTAIEKMTPQGGMFSGIFSGAFTTVPDDSDPGSIEKARKQHEEMKQLIVRKKYRLVQTLEPRAGSGKLYVYEFSHSDGQTSRMKFSMPLSNVDSWDDYVQKSHEQARHRNEAIGRAIAAGRFRLLDVEPISTHVCREVGSNRKLFVQRAELRDGKQLAIVRPEATDSPEYDTSWEEHLQAIQQGERELLDLEISKHYTYQITLDDGSTTLFVLGGSQPLKAPQ